MLIAFNLCIVHYSHCQVYYFVYCAPLPLSSVLLCVLCITPTVKCITLCIVHYSPCQVYYFVNCASLPRTNWINFRAVHHSQC